jgi:hypothetical protein
MAVYGRAQFHDLAGAGARMPSLMTPPGGEPAAQALRATGTGGPVCTGFAQTDDGGGRNLRVVDGDGEENTEDEARLELDDLQGVTGGCGLVMAGEGSSPSRTRRYWTPWISRWRGVGLVLQVAGGE